MTAVFWFAIVALALAGVLFLITLARRAVRVHQCRHDDRIRTTWWPVLAQAVTSGNAEVTVPPIGRRDEISVLREWCRFRQKVDGSAADQLRNLGLRLSLATVASRCVAAHYTPVRLIGIQAIGYLGEMRYIGELAGLLGHGNSAIAMTAARALVRLDADRALREITLRLGDNFDWPSGQIHRIFRLAGPERITRLLADALNGSYGDHLRKLLAFADLAHASTLEPAIIRVIGETGDAELIAACLRVLNGGIPIDLLRRLALHRKSFVRAHVAAYAGRSQLTEEFSILESLLCDSDWWVRYRAARSIVNSPWLGPNATRRVRDRVPDRYARDMLQQAMAEAGLE